MQNDFIVSVPARVRFFDGNNIRCKGRSLMRTYMKAKPERVGIRSERSWDKFTATCNPSLTMSPKNVQKAPLDSPIEMYLNIFVKQNSQNMDGIMIETASASELWFTRIERLTKRLSFSQHERLVLMESFYTRHVLGRPVDRLTDCETKKG